MISRFPLANNARSHPSSVRTAGYRGIARCLSALYAVPTAVLLGVIRTYQAVISPVIPVVLGPSCGCRFHPTCSHYALEAVRTHGAGRGFWLAVIRLLKCHPLHPGGIDPVPAINRRGRSSGPACVRVIT